MDLSGVVSLAAPGDVAGAVFCFGRITARTRAIYAAWVDMKDLAAEGDAMVGDPIAAAGLAYLREVNEHRPRRIRKVQD